MSNDLANNKAHGQQDTVSGHASEVFQESSVCAVSTILSTENKNRKIFRSVVFVLFTVAFFYQCIAFLYYVLQYPTIVDQENIRPMTFVKPAYTFCNYNLIKRSKFCETYPGNCTRPDTKFCFENPRFCGIPDTLILKEDTSDIDNVHERYELIHDVKDMVDIDEDEEQPVGPLPRANLNEASVAACFSFNERVDSPLDPLTKKRTPILVGLPEVLRFDPQENELLRPEAMAGMMFDVHSPFEPSNPFNTGFFMRPGYLYRVTVKMTQEELLPSDCVNYTEVWLNNNKKGYRSQEACRHKCLGDLVVKCFNCTEPNVLYPYPNTNLCRYGPENFNLLERPNLPQECISPEKPVLDCFKGCKEECLKMKYSYEVQENFLNNYAHEADKNESRAIRVVIEFPGLDIQKIVHKPQFQVLEVFSLIGGLLAFWIGLSMFQVVEVFDGIFQIVTYLFKKRSARSENSSA